MRSILFTPRHKLSLTQALQGGVFQLSFCLLHLATKANFFSWNDTRQTTLENFCLNNYIRANRASTKVARKKKSWLVNCLISSSLTSPSLECLFIRSSDSYFSFWFGTTLGILNRNLGLGGSIPKWGWKWGWWGGSPWGPGRKGGWWPGGGCPGVGCPGGGGGGPTSPLWGTVEPTTVVQVAGLVVTAGGPTEVTAFDDENESWAACAWKSF